MTQIPSPKFHPDMALLLLTGKKRCTSRTKKLGEIGDWFELKEQRFEFRNVWEETFGEIARGFYKCEGFESPEAFRAFWIRIHRGHLPENGTMKWLHVMRRME